MSTKLTPEQIADLIAKDQAKTRPWHDHVETPRCFFEARVAVRQPWEDFYRRVDEAIEDLFLDNPLGDLFVTTMRDGTAGRRNAGSIASLGYWDSEGELVTLQLPSPTAPTKVRDYLRSQYSGGVTAGGSSNTRLFRWSVAASRRGDEIGWYPTDHSVDLSYDGPSEDRAYAARISEAMFAAFVDALTRFPPIAGWATMSTTQWNRKFDHDNAYFHSPPDCAPFTAGYHWGLFIPNSDLDTLGGRDAVMATAPVEEVVSIETADGGSSPGVAVRLCRDVTEITDDLLARWRDYLDPVLDLADPSPPDPPASRPVDVLEQDWSPAPD